jgi:AbrB family transcriptional regulator, transcriptional pleiotropic regulator of transition state genes
MVAMERGGRKGVVQTGIVRHIDELGRIVIPSEIRKRFGLGEKDPVEISVRGETILLSKPHASCVFCGRDDALAEHRGRPVCRACIAELAASA